ncbi:hypothetical protein [Chryseobacterium vrystaatense]|uniref:DoxX protein n=1 Tax=Chryseobacterium vrystaatense TaxID=307480 RepID=A0A1M5NXR5_9FLAO|nr:hypothetical protein [Chryseobacterium vrystaatense]KFF26505.1 hypothetical protein IW16_11675 [Chryseobacterium vrystaatense]SHG93783.1 hypothetical protein SAMN02787073_5098 [Chryseobacterium vrystaatense]
MRKTMTLLRYVFAVILLLFGAIGTYAMITEGYNAQSEGIMLFGKTFHQLHDAIMMSYLGVFVRLAQLFAGILLLTKRYWWIGLLFYLPFAVNIFLIHIVHDLPPAHPGFFASGMIVSIMNFILVFYEKDRLKQLVVNPKTE